MWLITSSTNRKFDYKLVANLNIFSSSFEYKYDSEDGTYKYFLDNDSAVYYNIGNNTYISRYNNAHYTCFNDSGKCSTLYYISRYDSGYLYYFTLENGEDIEDLYADLLSNNSVNSTDSLLKKVTDIFYEKFLINYSNSLEDVIYCNDRTLKSYDSSFFNPHGGNIMNSFNFSSWGLSYPSVDLICENVTDKFSVSNNKAKLKYPIGHITNNELSILNVYKKFSFGLSMSPYAFSISGSLNCGTSIGGITSNCSVTPVISLNPYAFYTSGDGSATNPYIIDTN